VSKAKTLPHDEPFPDHHSVGFYASDIYSFYERSNRQTTSGTLRSLPINDSSAHIRNKQIRLRSIVTGIDEFSSDNPDTLTCPRFLPQSGAGSNTLIHHLPEETVIITISTLEYLISLRLQIKTAVLHPDPKRSVLTGCIIEFKHRPLMGAAVPSPQSGNGPWITRLIRYVKDLIAELETIRMMVATRHRKQDCK
jgi:hypothetical protein